MEAISSNLTVFGSGEIDPNKKTILFAANNTGAGQVIGRVIKVLDEVDKVNWVCYANQKLSGPVMKGFNFPLVESPISPFSAMDQLKPNLVVTGVSQTPGIEITMTLLGKRSGREVVWVIDSPKGVDAVHLLGMYRHGIVPDYLCTQNEAFRKFILDSKIPGIQNYPERVIATGQPHFDNIPDLCSSADQIRSEIRETLGLKDGEKSILFAGQLQGTRETFGDVVDELNSSSDEISLLVRFHPRDTNLGEYPEILSKSRNRWIDASFGVVANTQRLILATDAVLSMFSTLNMEAIALGKPTAYLLEQPMAREGFTTDWQVGVDDLPMDKDGAATLVRRKSDIAEFLNRIFHDSKFVDDMVKSQKANYLFDGQSAKRVADLIESIIGN